MAEFLKKLINTDVLSNINTNKMSLTFTEEEVKQLEEAICNSSAKRSYSCHKKDMKKFILAYFEKLGSSSGSNKSSRKKKVSGGKSKSQEKKSKESSSSKSPGKKTGNNGSSTSGYKIIKISKNYEFPSSVYKKSNPVDAAKSALKGIIRKNGLDGDVNFTFSVKTGDDTFKYNVRNGKLQV